MLFNPKFNRNGRVYGRYISEKQKEKKAGKFNLSQIMTHFQLTQIIKKIKRKSK